jgi:hypothetical protein
MDLYVVVLRLLHIVFGALWVGVAVFVPFFLVPSMNDAGPAAGPVMGALQRRGMSQVIAAFAGTSILAGILLLWRVSGGFRSEFMGSHQGIALSTGALLALIAFGFGMAVVKPSMERAGTLSQGLAGLTSDSERAAQLATIGALRAKGAAGGKLVAWLLLVALAAMAVARYL